MKPKLRKIIAVIGASEVTDNKMLIFAEKLGEKLAEKGYIILSGGLGGIMEAVSRGAKKKGGLTIGILPTMSKEDANPYIDIAIPTGMGWTRNSIVALTADIVIAIGGKSGTLSELAYAWMYNKPIIAIKGFGGWSEELAGKKIDDRRDDVIYGAEKVEDVMKLLEKFESGI